jgi:general secretion pathway protein G
VTGKSRHARSGGFTLIEVLIVMALIVILASTGLALYTNSVTRTKEAVLREDLFRMRDAISQYYADRNNYPATLQSLVDDKYLRSVPVDPFTDSSDTWQVVMADPDPSNPTAEIGVFDVKSGSDRTALDGSPYNDW